MSVWERIEEGRRRLDVTSADQVELRLLRRYVLGVEASLNELIAFADDSIGGQYGTMRASFVRDAAIAILEGDDA